jgi:hypothetical protein
VLNSVRFRTDSSPIAKTENGKISPVSWQRELSEIIQSSSLIPTFEQWLDATGYCEYVRALRAGNVNKQATAMNALYDYYQSEMRARFDR